MGFLDSKKSTVNQDNRIVNDYNGARWDNSSRFEFNRETDNSILTETDCSITGEYAGNTGNISVMDGGAFDLVAANMSDMAALASESFGLSYESIKVGENVASLGLDGGIDLAQTMAETSSTMLSDSLAASGEVFGLAAMALDSSNARASNLTAMITESGNELVYALAGQNSDSALVQQDNNNKALENGFKNTMQFVEQFSRSDGNTIAETNMKTIGIIGVALVFSVYVYKKAK